MSDHHELRNVLPLLLGNVHQLVSFAQQSIVGIAVPLFQVNPTTRVFSVYAWQGGRLLNAQRLCLMSLDFTCETGGIQRLFMNYSGLFYFAQQCFENREAGNRIAIVKISQDIGVCFPPGGSLDWTATTNIYLNRTGQHFIADFGPELGLASSSAHDYLISIGDSAFFRIHRVE